MITIADKAEVSALRGRNLKTRWLENWQKSNNGTPGENALRSPLLAESLRFYSEAAELDPGSYYAGLNALSLLVIRLELAKSWPEVWADQFETDEEAKAAIARLERERSIFGASVELSLRSAERDGQDFSAKLSRAELALYTGGRISRATTAYRQAFLEAPSFAQESARAQLLLLVSLGVLEDSVRAVLNLFSNATESLPKNAQAFAPAVALLFAGHTVDGPDRKEKRFPPGSESEVRTMIARSL